MKPTDRPRGETSCPRQLRPTGCWSMGLLCGGPLRRGACAPSPVAAGIPRPLVPPLLSLVPVLPFLSFLVASSSLPGACASSGPSLLCGVPFSSARVNACPLQNPVSSPSECRCVVLASACPCVVLCPRVPLTSGLNQNKAARSLARWYRERTIIFELNKGVPAQLIPMCARTDTGT